MTDLHTHILPGIDDGSENAKKSIAMLRTERDQGVKTVVLTPHFYRDRENPRRFFRRRREAMLTLQEEINNLPEEERKSLPQLVLGAEVAWWPDMDEWEEIHELCIGETKNMLIELPFTRWNNHVVDQLYNFAGRTGITPIFAHLDRYLKIQHPVLIDDILDLNFPIQMSTDSIISMFKRGKILTLLKNGKGSLIASDCHDDKRRAPNLKAAMDIIRQKMGEGNVADFIRCADELAGIVTDNSMDLTSEN